VTADIADRANRANRAMAAYLGLAIGDALGATVEFLTPNEIRHQHGVHREIRGGGWLRLKPGQVTDDTTMALALGRAILACDGRVEALACAQAFDAWMRAKPVDIGNTVRRNLVSFRHSGDPVAPFSEHDAGNGAAMRVLPVALATLGQPAEAVAAAVRAQAHVTHNNSLSDAACDTLVAMIQAALAKVGAGGTAQNLGYFATVLVARHPEFAFDGRRRDNPSGYVVETLHAVFQAFFATDSFEACLIDVVNRGGDADTTGAICGMLAGALYGLEAIPARWLKALDAGMRTSCATQAGELLAVSCDAA
jgi:ADP-ribosyl-[dinitrogen reductase] hydrolase